MDLYSFEQQDAIRKAARKAIDLERKQNRKIVMETVAKIEAKGMKVNKVSDFKPFQEKVKKVYDQFRPNIGDEIFNQVLLK